ncbi:response regulators consisting of a cheY-like receiver domain and a winged-helix DNA-binding domain [Candidatus Scalindua japonica]|uniref:Response regulators consisting of a cheY-like receiver domain and a winged-helix DNA-binding domain n=1 Tax=Candidatus Scalindua japonica TaxID=1284222 RepID=A0A286TVT7_9BACT|nr:response regulator [Candidatus Scalindua japonica]GAX59993.1 response regulators consisting of a cheY-like receiver domain and a winged-helix DNA-binding domain [Candidatus Scalindua japonica]
MNTILVVDDNTNICYMMKHYLEEMKYDVITSHSGMDALEKVKNLKPDVMLLDIVMTGMGGLEVLRRVRLFDKDIGIIMISGLLDNTFSKTAFENGADEYITKPFDLDHLHECILVDLIMRSKQ